MRLQSKFGTVAVNRRFLSLLQMLLLLLQRSLPLPQTLQDRFITHNSTRSNADPCFTSLIKIRKIACREISLIYASKLLHKWEQLGLQSLPQNRKPGSLDPPRPHWGSARRCRLTTGGLLMLGSKHKLWWFWRTTFSCTKVRIFLLFLLLVCLFCSPL